MEVRVASRFACRFLRRQLRAALVRTRDRIDRRVERLDARQQELAAAIEEKAARVTPAAAAAPPARPRTRRRATPTPRM